MTVAELKAELDKYPDDMQVYTRVADMGSGAGPGHPYYFQAEYEVTSGSYMAGFEPITGAYYDGFYVGVGLEKGSIKGVIIE